LHNEKAYWTLQRKILAVAVTFTAVCGSMTIICVNAKSIAEPYVEKVCMRLDTLNHFPLESSISEIRRDAKKTDTNIQIIKSILEVIATNDQLILAQNRRTNPTGIR
jgi:hypothetical protein